MSHNITIKDVKITDMGALKSAIKELQGEGVGITLHDNGTFRSYSGQDNKSDYTIEVKNSNHDVGLVKQEDGSYSAVFDPYGGGVNKALGADRKFVTGHDPKAFIGKLMQTYALCKAEVESAMQGYTTSREMNLETGVISLVVEGM